jgi:predicted nucleic acid binding AN1-type Zn finger protein
MDRVTRLCAIAVFASGSAYANEVSPNRGEEIIIADEVRTAFYEQAPRSLAGGMSKAVGSCLLDSGSSSCRGQRQGECGNGWLAVWKRQLALLSQCLRYRDEGPSRIGL